MSQDINPLMWLLLTLIDVVFFLVLIQLIIGLLLNFDVLNRRQRVYPFATQVYYGINQLLDPVLNPIRRVLPPTGGIDFSPLVLLIGLQFLVVSLNWLR